MTDITEVLGRPLTVAEAALIDAQKGREAMARRQRQMNGGHDPAVPMTDADADPRTPKWSAEMLAALTRPVRIEIDFRDPIHVREQIDALTEVLREAREATFDHSPGLGRQLMRLHSIIKAGAVVLCYMNGKAPSGKRKLGAK